MIIKLVTFAIFLYLLIIDATCKITVTGNVGLLYGEEKFVVVFWHGESFSYFPLLKHRGDIIVTTIYNRGQIIAGYGRKFGYIPYQMPNDSNPSVTAPDIKRMLTDSVSRHICCTMDGPTGPYRIPKQFCYKTAKLAKKRILPLSVEIERKITSKKRWDKFKLPLPFARITFHVHEPLDTEDVSFDEFSSKITNIM